MLAYWLLYLCGFCLVITQGLLSGTPVTPPGKSWISSIINNKHAGLVNDPNPATCSESGDHTYSFWYVDLGSEKTVKGVSINESGDHTYSFWYVDLGSEKTVKGVSINGVKLKNVYIMVKSGIPERDVTEIRNVERGLCNVHKEAIIDNTSKKIECATPMKGRYLVVEMIPVKEGDIHRMKLCDVKIFY